MWYHNRVDTTSGRLAQLVEHLLDVQEVTGSSPVPSTKRKPLTKVRGFFVASAAVSCQSRTVQDSNRAALTTPVGRVSNQPSGLLLSPRFPTARNVYQERCRQTIRSGDFFRSGRYRTRTARPRRRRGNKHPSGVFVSARFSTPRNVYQERCRPTIRSGDFFRGGGTGLERQ